MSVLQWRLLRRMKACIDELEPNTSQANYSEGFWRIKSQTNANIEVTKKRKCNLASGPWSGTHSVETQWNPSRWAFCLQKPHLFWWLLSVNLCLLVFNSTFHGETKKYSVFRKQIGLTIGQYKIWTADCRVRTADCGLSIKYRLGIKRGLENMDWWGVLPKISHIGMYRPKGRGFWAFLVWKDFPHFGLESGMVFEGTTGAYMNGRIYRFNSKRIRTKSKYADLKCI